MEFKYLKNLHKDRSLGVWLIIASIIGSYSALALVLDDLKLWKAKAVGEEAILGCNINPIVGCGDVLQTPQASAFGFPNPIIGVIAWSILLGLAITISTSSNIKKWVWWGIQAGVTFGFGFVTWLQYQTIFNLNMLCPWCMVTWSVMIPTFFLVTARNLKKFKMNSFTTAFYKWRFYLIFVWFLLLITVIYSHFGNSIFS